MTPPQFDADIAIIGAGAAGLAAAIFAGENAMQSGRRMRIVLMDGAKKPGAKILVSGGGRCNVTHARVSAADYCGGSARIIRNVLSRFNESRTLEWMSSMGVGLKLEETGKYFPVTDSARTVLDALMHRVGELGIEMRFGYRVSNVSPISEPEIGWVITPSNPEREIRVRVLIVATGGRALPKSGSDGAAYPWLERIGHSIIPTVPALAPLILDPRGLPGSPLSEHFADLSGISLEARLEFVVEGRVLGSFKGSTLFTHFGLSGPAPMNLSRHIARHRQANPVSNPGHLRLGLVQFDDAMAADAWLMQQTKQRPRASVGNILREIMPDRIAAVLASSGAVERLADLRKDQRASLARLLTGSPLAVKGDRGYAFAEATAGGVSLDEISWKTMASRKAENLYLVGEVLDVDGRIGGFNFQWAWSTGYIAGVAATGFFCGPSRAGV